MVGRRDVPTRSGRDQARRLDFKSSLEVVSSSPVEGLRVMHE